MAQKAPSPLASAMAKATKAFLLPRLVLWSGAALLVLSAPLASGYLNTSSDVVDTRTTSALYTFVPGNTSSSSTGPTSSNGLCVASNTACLADADCAACELLSSGEGDSGKPCNARYSAYFTSSAATCEIAAATYCCYYENESTAESCLANEPTADYWECVLTSLGMDCVLEDMPCYGGVPTEAPTPSPSPPTPSPSPLTRGNESSPPSTATATGLSPTASDRPQQSTQAPTAIPSSTTFSPSSSPSASNDIEATLNSASRMTSGALAPWKLVLFAWGIGIWLFNFLADAPC